MAVQSREWLDNAFWHTKEKDCAEAFLILRDESDREISQCLTVRKTTDKGEDNPDFIELVESIGMEKIDANTAEREERKEKEKEQAGTRQKAEEQAKDLERLFDSKIKILSIDSISKTKNKTLKSKLRRSKNIVELNMYAQLIMMEENGIGFVTYDAEQKD